MKQHAAIKADESQAAGHLVASNPNREPPHYSAVSAGFLWGSFHTQDLLVPGFRYFLLIKSEVTQSTTIECLVKYVIFVKLEIMCEKPKLSACASRCNNIKMLIKINQNTIQLFI